MGFGRMGVGAIVALLLTAAMPAIVLADNASGSPSPTASVIPSATAHPTGQPSDLTARQHAIDVALTSAIQKLEGVISHLEANGQDVTELKAVLDRLKATRERFVAATNLGDAQRELAQAKSEHEELREKARTRAEDVSKRKCTAVTTRAKGLFDRLHKLLAKMKAAGVDTSALETKLAAIEQKFGSAEGKCGQQIREAAHELGDANRLFAGFRKDLREAARAAAEHGAKNKTRGNETNESNESG